MSRAAVAAALIATLAPPAACDGQNRRWTALDPSTVARSEVSAARIGHFIYVIRGSEAGPATTSNVIESLRVG